MTKARQLAAIMFTDMVGYSAIAQKDEALALELLEEHRTILRPIFPRYDGHEVETIGDAFFVEFASALEAVKCAIDIQKTLWQRNKDLPEERLIRIRIGIHLGDVIHRDKNVLGDGVNIAARLEPLAPPCGICVSEDVARQIQNKIDFPLEELQKTQLKNIQLPVTVFSILLPWLDKNLQSRSSRRKKRIFLYLAGTILITTLLITGINRIAFSGHDTSTAIQAAPWQNSIAVLPFADLSPQKDQEYFCDGMTEQILTNLAQLNTLKVIARTSAMKFKNTKKTVPEIAKELDVKNILEGSVRKFGDRIRVTVQLIRSEDGSHIWAEDYDRQYAELFTLQDEISKSIANKLSEKLTSRDIKKIRTTQAVNLEAYEYYLKGQYQHRNKYWSTLSVDDFKDAELMFLKAIHLDSTYAPAYAELVDLYNTFWNTQPLDETEKQKYLYLQEKYINIAYDLDSTSADVNRVMGWVYSARGETVKKFAFMKKAVRLKPNDPENSRALGVSYDIIGLKNLAFKYYTHCIQLDPYDAKYYYYRGYVHFQMGRFKEAKPDFQRALKLEPYGQKYFLYYTFLLFLMKEYHEAEIMAAKYKQLNPNNLDNRFLDALIYASNNQKDKALALELRREHKILIDLYVKETDQALQSIQDYFSGYENSERSHYLVFKNQPLYAFLQTNPRFQEIMSAHKKVYLMNLKKYDSN